MGLGLNARSANPLAERKVNFKGTVRLTALCVFFALASFVWGYNIGALTSTYAHPGWKKALHKPSASKTGLITAIYYAGTWVSYIFLSHPASDKLGRRYAAALGVLVNCIGSSIMASAGGKNPFAMMVIGRVICGLGIALVSTSVPLYQSEISPARQRGRYVVMNHIGLVAGLAVAFWVGYGMTFWDNKKGTYLGWRLSIAVQFIPAVIFMVGAPFTPETPRWLVKQGQLERARSALAYLRGTEVGDPLVEEEFAQIQTDVAEYTSAPDQSDWKLLFTQRPLFERLWRAALLHFMAQVCGATSMKYYLPTNLLALGLGRRLSLLAGGIESTLKIPCTVVEMFLIDKLGRRVTLIGGGLIMAFAMMINGALPQAYPGNKNHAADYACIVFIFIYTFGYSLGFGPAAWVYGSEIFPTKLRARGLNFAASGGSIGSIITAQVWPIGLANIGSKVYYVFMVLNLVSSIIIFFFYPETKHRPLEDMDSIFEGRRSGLRNTATHNDHDIEAEAEGSHSVQPQKTV